MTAIDAYARDVVEGRLPAGKYHQLACARHLKDRAREGTPGFPFRFDAARADRFVRFVSHLRHYKGEWAGQPVTLEPWQLFILGSLFAWVHVETGFRRFRATYFEIPRAQERRRIRTLERQLREAERRLAQARGDPTTSSEASPP